MKKLVILLLSVCLFSGCMPHTELDRAAIIEAVGIDYADGEYTVTVQYFNMDGAGGTTLVDNTKPNVIVVSGRGSTIGAALDNASFICGKSFMQGITGLIVIGREAAGQELSKLLSFAYSHYQNNPKSLVAVADSKAEDIMNVRFKEGSASADKMEMLFENAEHKGLCTPVRLYDIMIRLSQPTKSVILPLISSISDGGDFTDDGKNITIIGGALFSAGRMCGILNPLECAGMQYLSGNVQTAEMTVQLGGHDVTVMLYNVRTQLTPLFDGEKLTIDAAVCADGKYVSGSLPEPVNERADVGKLCAERVEKSMIAAAEKTLASVGADAADIKYAITSKDFGMWQEISPEYRSILRDSEIKPHCEVTIKRFGITRG